MLYDRIPLKREGVTEMTNWYEISRNDQVVGDKTKKLIFSLTKKKMKIILKKLKSYFFSVSLLKNIIFS